MRHDSWGGLPPQHPVYCTCVDCAAARLRRRERGSRRGRRGLKVWAMARALRRFGGRLLRVLGLDFPEP